MKYFLITLFVMGQIYFAQLEPFSDRELPGKLYNRPYKFPASYKFYEDDEDIRNEANTSIEHSEVFSNIAINSDINKVPNDMNTINIYPVNFWGWIIKFFKLSGYIMRDIRGVKISNAAVKFNFESIADFVDKEFSKSYELRQLFCVFSDGNLDEKYKAVQDLLNMEGMTDNMKKDIYFYLEVFNERKLEFYRSLYC